MSDPTAPLNELLKHLKDHVDDPDAQLNAECTLISFEEAELILTALRAQQAQPVAGWEPTMAAICGRCGDNYGSHAGNDCPDRKGKFAPSLAQTRREVVEECAIRDCLAELLRLYDWRNELGAIERNPEHDKKEMTRNLNRYGREKKEAWTVARTLLAPETK